MKNARNSKKKCQRRRDSAVCRTELLASIFFFGGPMGHKAPTRKKEICLQPKLPSGAPTLSRLFWTYVSRFCAVLTFFAIFFFFKKESIFSDLLTFLTILCKHYTFWPPWDALEVSRDPKGFPGDPKGAP